ncbi:MAG: sensor histidine kinase [Sedimentisphaerales bacterium]
MHVELQSFALYGIALLLSLYNVVVLQFLNHFAKNNHEVCHSAVKRIINLQVSADLLLLTVLLHFSGGIENPLVFYFIFHMIIASILLSSKESYLQATLAVLLFGLLVLLEYLQLISHHCLTGFVPHCLHRDGLYVLGTWFVFTTALYLAVYMATYIAVRLKRAEQAYRQTNILLQEKDRIKDEYVLRLTHDVKGHLATIQSCLGLVVKGFAKRIEPRLGAPNKVIGPFDNQQADLIHRAHSRTAKLTNFVKTLLKLTQMRLSNELEMDVFSLRDAIHNAVATVKTKAEDKSIALNCNIEPSVDGIFGNQFSIEEMVANLLLNAIKYTPANGTIEVKVKNHEDCVLLEVADTGIGIPKEEQPKIFCEFYRATNARRVERDGTGLGLSIVKYIVETHGGQIQIESKEGCGTTFRVTLPKTKQL